MQQNSSVSRWDRKALARRPGPAHARPSILRRVLWAGLPAAGLMIAIAQAPSHPIHILDNCGTVIFLTCALGLPLRRWFEHRAERLPRWVEQELRTLGQRQAWSDQELRTIRRAVTEAFQHADRDVPDTLDELGKRRRHLRPVRLAVSDDTGPQQAVLG